MIERMMQYFKDRTESFDDYYSCNCNNNCDLQHVYNWIKLFAYLHNEKTEMQSFLKFEVN